TEQRQHLATMDGNIELPGVVAEHVVDEPRRQFQEELAAERLQGLLDVHAVVEETFQDQVTDLVVVERSGEHLLGGVPKGRAAVTPGLILAAGDLEESHGLVPDGADPARREFPLACAGLAALGARCFLGSAVNRYNNGCGCIRAHARVLGGEAVLRTSIPSTRVLTFKPN